MPAAKKASPRTKKKAGDEKPLTIYIRHTGGAYVGPVGQYKVGDRVTIPDRKPGWPHRDHMAGFDGVVKRIEADGLAFVGLPPEEGV